MKKLFILVLAVIFASCTWHHSNNTVTETVTDETLIEDTLTEETIVEEEPIVEEDPFASGPVVIPIEPDWNKPLYCIGVDDDTVAKWVYDEQGRIAKILFNFGQDGHPSCVRTYEYVGDTTFATFHCKDGTQNRRRAYDSDYQEGFFAAYDGQGWLQYLEINYTPENTFEYSFMSPIEVDEYGEALEEPGDQEYDWRVEYDELGRITEDSRIVRGLDIEATYYEYEGRVCHGRAYYLLYARDEDGFITEDYDTTEIEYYYDIYY